MDDLMRVINERGYLVMASDLEFRRGDIVRGSQVSGMD
jgi:hypothetical protein